MTTDQNAPSLEDLVGEIALVERAIADLSDEVVGPDGELDPTLVELIVREYDAVTQLHRHGAAIQLRRPDPELGSLLAEGGPAAG